MKHCNQMKIIGRAGVGVDNINIAEATRNGIMVMNTPGGNTVSTAQLAMSLLCSVARKIPQGKPAMQKVKPRVWYSTQFVITLVCNFASSADASVKDGKWDPKSFSGSSVSCTNYFSEHNPVIITYNHVYLYRRRDEWQNTRNCRMWSNWSSGRRVRKGSWYACDWI